MENNIKILFIILPVIFFSGCMMNTGIGVVDGESFENVTITTRSDIHYENHLGNVYMNNFNDTLTAGEIIYFMACPTTKEVHFISLELKSNNAPIMVELWENPTLTSNGTQINITSTNRELNLPHVTNIYANPTVIDDGTKLFRDFILSGGGNKVLNQFLLTGEIILSTEYCYTIKVTNQDGNNNDVVGTLFMYEE